MLLGGEAEILYELVIVRIYLCNAQTTYSPPVETVLPPSTRHKRRLEYALFFVLFGCVLPVPTRNSIVIIDQHIHSPNF